VARWWPDSQIVIVAKQKISHTGVKKGNQSRTRKL
jgi:hypothetical protein